MTSIPIESPPAITLETTAGIVQRHSEHTDSFSKADWATQAEAHCRLMACMSNDRRIQYLETAGCDDDTVRLVTRSIAEIIEKAAKPALRSAARECVLSNNDIESLLKRWPEPEHFRLLSSKIAGLNEEQISLGNAYAACQIYDTAASALYLAIVDSLAPVVTEDPSDLDTMTRDQAIADAGYTDEVARWPK